MTGEQGVVHAKDSLNLAKSGEDRGPRVAPSATVQAEAEAQDAQVADVVLPGFWEPLLDVHEHWEACAMPEQWDLMEGESLATLLCSNSPWTVREAIVEATVSP
jgi:hypothetical protein